VAGEIAARFGQRIRQRRDELRLTQKQVAMRIGALLPEMAMDKQRVSDWERGANTPSDRYRDALVTALEVDDISYFLLPAEKIETPDLSRNGNQLDEINRKLDLILAQLDTGPIGQIIQVLAGAMGQQSPPTEPRPPTPAVAQTRKAPRRRPAA
jgi:transcriptional regulator with XRE-family HTH domain